MTCATRNAFISKHNFIETLLLELTTVCTIGEKKKVMFIIRNGCQALCTAAAQQPILKVRQRKEVILVYEGLFQLVLFFGLFVYYIPKY